MRVGVIRRNLARDAERRPMATRPDVVRFDVARLLVSESSADAGGLHDIASDLGADDSAWAQAAMWLDGECVEAQECEYDGAWAVFHMRDDIFVYVVCLLGDRPSGPVELRVLSADEVARCPNSGGAG